ncbi:MAG: NAD-dependent epimerase/dehydratase family protein [Nitrososphaerota archaeon]|jgi:UDP-glucose 4-epimerase|nr:NAD-dependent epimerase/dehydratase family protein [Nitrososphaerota archaeon]
MGNYLVTGGTGQIGAFLCEELVNAGHRVVCYDFKPNMDNVGRLANRLTVEAADVTDPTDLLHTIKENSVDHIIHLAALVLLDSIKHPARAYNVNIIGTNNVMEAARLLDVKKVVFASSVSVYGSLNPRRAGIADEDDIPNPPHDPYSTSKITNELMGKYYRESYGMDVTCMRITAAWGPGRYWGYTGQFNEFIRRAALGQDVPFPSDFSYRLEKLRWMYVKDVGYCFSFVSELPRRDYLYNLGVMSPFNHKDVIESLSEILSGRKFEVKELDAPTTVSSGVAGPNGLDVDCTKLHNQLGFRPRFGLKSALDDMVRFERGKAGIPPNA